MSQVQGRETASGPTPPLIDDERAELERLRQENLTLRTSGRPPRRRVRWRSVIAAVLLVLGCLLAPLSAGRRVDPQPGLRHRPVRRHDRTTDHRPRSTTSDHQPGHHHGLRVRPRRGPRQRGHRRTGRSERATRTRPTPPRPDPHPRLRGHRFRARQGRPTRGQPTVRRRLEPSRPHGPPTSGHRPVRRQPGHRGQGRHDLPRPRTLHRRSQTTVECGWADDRRPHPRGPPHYRDRTRRPTGPRPERLHRARHRRRGPALDHPAAPRRRGVPGPQPDARPGRGRTRHRRRPDRPRSPGC